MEMSRTLKMACDSSVSLLMRDVKGVKAVLLSSEDGFEVAAQVENTAQVSRLSAMASSMAALSALAGEESQLGSCSSLVMEAAEGFIAVFRVGRRDGPMIMSVVAGRDAVIGQLLYVSKQVVGALEKAPN